MAIVGKCGNCGGMVTSPDYYYGDYAECKCRSCGADAEQPYVPVIPMKSPAPDSEKYWRRYN